MLTILHGDDITSSRKYYIDERQKVETPIILFGNDLSMNHLSQVFQSTSLFDVAQKNVFIENFFQKKENKEFVPYLQAQLKKSNILIWEPKELSKTQINLFKNANIKRFLLPKALFAFLNELKPNNNKKTISLFHKALEQAECELIFFMIIRQFRLFLATQKESLENQIDEIKRMVPWQKSRLGSQAKLFSKNKLKEIFRKVMEIDVSQKTGKSILSLPQAIDFLLLSL